MAKKKTDQPDPKAATLARIKRTEAYAERVRLLFATTVDQILALNKTLPKLAEGEMFSFDGQSIKKQNEVERLLRQLHSVATMAIQHGISLEWSQANAEADKLVNSIYGQAVLSNPTFKAWTSRNGSAMNAFINRSEKGLNLSDRVWKAVRQLRDEMEVAITLSIGEGKSAQRMSQDVREYLNDPDLMFRRFKYKAGEEDILDEEGNIIGTKPIYKKKWKKRIRKPDGTYGFVDCDRDTYKTGAGVYKSSAKNAMRVTRTETNIAYRRADHERWQAMDFVIGQRVQLSRSHPKKDICDKLAGDYPKDFVFDGWHPQCFCYVTPITLPIDDMTRISQMMANGEDWRAELARLKQTKSIKDYPDNFKQWVADNADNIEAARDRGTEPYFIRNNARAINKILYPQPEEELTTLQRAEKRHEERTPEQAEAIRLKWQERQERIAAEKKKAHISVVASKYGKGILSIMNDIPGVDTSALRDAIAKGDVTLIQEEAKKLRLLGKQFKADAHSALGTATTYGEVSGAALDAAIKAGNIKAIWKETKALQKQIADTQTKEDELDLIIPDAHDWHHKFTFAEMDAAVAGVQTRMARETFGSLTEKEKWLKEEINWVETHKKYNTWPLAKAAYEKELQSTIRKIEEEAILNDVRTALAFALLTSDRDYLQLVAEMRAILSTPGYSIAIAKAKAQQLNQAYARLNQTQTGDAPTKATIPDYCKARRETVFELRERMGSQTPATLQALEKAISKYEKSSKYGTEAKKYKDEIEANMRKIFDMHDFGMNISEKSIELVLDSWFKNTFETGSSGGYCGSSKTDGKIDSSHGRLKAAHELFGLDKDLDNGQLPRGEYEKYGNLLDHDIAASLKKGTASGYGRVEVRFKKDMVIATWTAEDSLGTGYQPSLTSDPKACSFDGRRRVPHDLNESIIDLKDWKDKYVGCYLELQYHGKLTIDCVESISYPYDLTDKSRASELQIARRWKATGVTIYYLTNSGLMRL